MHPLTASGRVYGKHYSYTITPYKQKLFTGFFSGAIPRFNKWLSVNKLILLPVGIVFGTISWAEHTYHEEQKKKWY